MRVALPCLAVLTASIAISSAAPPRERPLVHFKELWEDSLMTSDPEPPNPPDPAPNPLDDYTLASVCRLGDGWHVVLLHKTKRDERVRLKSDEGNALGFRIVTVENATERSKAAVEIQAGTHTATMHFEAKFVTQLHKAPAASSKLHGKVQHPNSRIRKVSSQNSGNVRRIPTPANQ